LLAKLFESYDDARTCERQINDIFLRILPSTNPLEVRGPHVKKG